MTIGGEFLRRSAKGRRSFLATYLASGLYRLARSGFRTAYPRGEDLRRYLSIEEHAYRNNQFLLALPHILGVRRINAITASYACGDEGGGYQTLMRMRAMAFARAARLAYVHTPIYFAEHADRPVDDFAATWEATFNLGEGHVISNGVDLGLFDFTWSPNFISPAMFGGVDSHPAFAEMVPEFRKRYRDINPPTLAARDRAIVCIHVRRGDIDASRPDMWTADRDIARLIRLLLDIFATARLEHEIVLVSEGSPADFDELTSLSNRIRLVLDEDPFASLRLLIDADILVMAKSSFSYIAAVISEGVVLYDPSSYAPLPGWIQLGPGGRFDTALLQRQIRERLSAYCNKA